MTRILIIEDSATWQGTYRASLPSTVEIVEARNFVAASTAIVELAANVSAFDAIVVDGCLYGDDFDTPPLIQQALSLGFKGPIIAGSSNPRLNIMLMERGCTHDARIKERVVGLLRYLFNIPRQTPSRS